MPEGAIYVFIGLVCVLFIGVGILGIYKKIQFRKSIRNMHMIDGVLVDTTVAQRRDENDIHQMWDEYFPIYEYEWGGVKKRLESHTNASRIKIGRKVHILVDPKTEEAICLEEQNASDSLLLIFGVIGVLFFIMVVLLFTGVLS